MIEHKIQILLNPFMDYHKSNSSTEMQITDEVDFLGLIFINLTHLLTQAQVLMSFPPVPGTKNLSGLSRHEVGAGDMDGAEDPFPFPFPPLLWSLKTTCATQQ